MDSIQKPYLSIILPCYNGERFVEDAILSVLSQPAFSEAELLVINDGSTDGTDAICRKYADRIRYFTIPNGGTGHARNIGIRKAMGDWVMFLDADDLFLSNSLSFEFVDRMKQHEFNGVDVLCTAYVSADMELRRYVRLHLAEDPDEIGVMPKHAFGSCVYSRAFLMSRNIYFYEYAEQDIETAFRIMVWYHNPRVITNNAIRFYLQRNNLQSNTHTWKNSTLHRVKAHVYYDLFEKYSTAQTARYLFETAIEQVHLFFNEVYVSRCISKKDLRAMNRLYLACLKSNFWRTHKEAKLARRHVFAGGIRCVLANLSCRNHDLQEAVCEKKAQLPIHVLCRLDKVSCLVKSWE